MRMLVFDTESTSPVPTTARIVTAFLSVLDADGTVQMAQDWLIRPGAEHPIPAEATAIHGVTQEHAVEHGMHAGNAIDQIASIIRVECVDNGLPLVGHNLRYDLTLLDREMRRHGMANLAAWLLPRVKVLDSIILDKHLDRYRKGKRTLTATAEHYDIRLDDAHTASADAVAAGLIAQRLLSHDTLRDMPLDVIHEAEVIWAKEQAEGLRAYFLREGNTEAAASVHTEWPVIPA